MILSDSGGTSFEQPPTGSHAARCISIIDLGTQRSTYEGEAQIKRQVVLRWELGNELMQDGEYKGKPFTVSRFYTASLHEKAVLRKDLASWRGRDFSADELKGFDLKSILGKPCMLAVGLTEKGKVKVTSVMGLPKGMAAAPQINPNFYFTLDGDQYSEKDFEPLSKGFKEMVRASPEYQAIQRSKTGAPSNKKDDAAPAAKPTSGFDDMDDDIPF
jgi:hypothetical protein